MTYGFKWRVRNGRVEGEGMAVGNRSRKVRDHIFKGKHEAPRANEKWS